MQRLRLRNQIALATFLPLVIFALLSMGVAGYALRKIPDDLIVQRQTAITEVAAAGAAGNLRGYVRLLEATAQELSQHTGFPAQQREILHNQAPLLSVFSGGVALLDQRGTAVAVTPPAQASVGLNYAFRDYFRQVQANQSSMFSAVIQDQPAGFDAVVIAAPVTQNGVFEGVCVGEFALDRREWARDLDLLRTPEGGRAYLIDSAGVIIYHPDPARIGINVSNDPDLLKLISGRQARSILYRTAGNGQPWLVTFAPITGIGWGVIMEEPWQAALGWLTPYQWAAGGLLALGMALALAALVVSINRVTRPMNALIAQGRRVTQGEPFQAVEVAGPADLQMLLQAVNQMVARLAEHQAALQRYATQILRSQEEERLRLSRDLHDETVQDLVALNQRIDLCSDLMQDDPTAAQELMEELRDLASTTLTQVRRMSRNLRPFVLEDLGLGAACQNLARELEGQMAKARVSCEIVGEPARLPAELELTTYRVAQEALNNIRKHAATATRVQVALFYEERELLLMVEDNGPGFQMLDRDSLMRQGHLGLIGMRERAELFGGKLEVASVPGEGTTVSLRFA